VIEENVDFLQSKRPVMIAVLKLAIVSLQRLVFNFQRVEPTLERARGGLADVVEFFAEFFKLFASMGDLGIEMVRGVMIHDGFGFIQLSHYPLRQSFATRFPTRHDAAHQRIGARSGLGRRRPSR
jgi:hypothetical protein